MLKYSSVAANRYLKKCDSNAFYCNISLVEAYANFKSEILLDLSFSSFYKYVGEQFKKPHRFSDLCEYCENYKVKIFYFISKFFISEVKNYNVSRVSVCY
jgi:hypothetical protein